MATQISGNKSMKDYLKRYQSNNDEDDTKKKRKKKKVKPDVPGVLVLDEDPVWQKPVKHDEEEDNDSVDEEKPQVDEDIEVKRMKRLEQLRLRRAYNVIAEDGSGWVSLSTNGENVGNSNSDISPPRRHRARNDTPSPEPGERDLGAGRNEAHLSPPRNQRARKDTPSPEPSMKDADLSPPRKHRAQNVTPSLEASTKDADLSPPRKHKAQNDMPSLDPSREYANLSPLQQHQGRYCTPLLEHVQDSDISPPRRSRVRTSEFSGRRKLEASDSSMSCHRQAHQNSPYHNEAHLSPESDLSPPRKNWMDVGKLGSLDLSPQRLPKRSSSTADGTSHVNSDKDISVKGKSRKHSPGSTSLKEPPKTGLITGQDIKEEISKTRKNELLRFEQMDPSMSGRGAEPVYRDKKGQRISKEEYLKSKQRVEEKPKEKKLEWGKGLAQKREAEARLLELELEKDKPFARARDDPELDKMLKERVRWGDPMAHLVKKNLPEPVLADLGDSEKMKESGFIVPQEIPNHSWIKRRLDAAPNRYGLKPGRHWDGVDRSNGFEKKMFQRLNEKRANEREAYLWSVSDM